MVYYGSLAARFVFTGATKRPKIRSNDRSSFDDRWDLDKYRARDPTDGYLDGWTVCGFWKFDEQEAFSLSITLPINYEGVFFHIFQGMPSNPTLKIEIEIQSTSLCTPKSRSNLYSSSPVPRNWCPLCPPSRQLTVEIISAC